MKYFILLMILIGSFNSHAADIASKDVSENLPDINIDSSDVQNSEKENVSPENQTETEKAVSKGDNIEYKVFTPQFMKNLSICHQDEEKSGNSFLKIIGIQQQKCHLQYNSFDLYIPQDILPNIHGFDDMKILLKNKDITQYNYQPRYLYKGLLFALNACREGKSYSMPMEIYDHGEISETSGLFSEKNQKLCVITLYNAMTIDADATDYSVICRISEDVLNNILTHYTDMIAQYGEKRYFSAQGKVQVKREEHNSQTALVDKEILFYLQQKNHCRKPSAL